MINPPIVMIEDGVLNSPIVMIKGSVQPSNSNDGDGVLNALLRVICNGLIARFMC